MKYTNPWIRLLADLPPTESQETADDIAKPKDLDGFESSVAAGPSVGKRYSVKEVFCQRDVLEGASSRVGDWTYGAGLTMR